ncbi:MAG: glutamine synthetase III [Candidatus Altiarchaeota archaeon]
MEPLEQKWLTGTYGENVFNMKAMNEFLPKDVLESLKDIDMGNPLPEGIADDVADGMKRWALSKGATHYTHWFQPMTGLTAEKHDAFISPTKEGGAMLKFSGKELTQGEPDASSFPSGGIRATFEARGYTAWDPTSPAFIKYTDEGPTLCIPTAFFSYHGEALDKKTPLLRSTQAISDATRRMLKLFDKRIPNGKAYCQIGLEQEYFLVDREYYLARPDLIATGRTLYGRRPAKHQQMEDHYFGSIKPRILKFMEEVDRECWKLGIPAKTRHNEVAPAQFEIAPVFEELNIGIDHNMMLMQILKETAEKHGLVCLLHEKPFAGVNGSGKHNNWSIAGPDGKNLLDPGDNPHENAKFLTFLCAVIKAVDTHAKLLRATVASAGNDHRLGANEAPPAIISIFLGDQLTDIIEQMEKNGGARTSKHEAVIKLGVTALPHIPKDATDRNRTSPFAFTGNKFEFRAVGSAQSPSDANTVLNVIVAEALDEIANELEDSVKKGADFNEALQAILHNIVVKHKRVIFNGDNYTKEWEEAAERRGLPNIKTSDEALKALALKDSIEIFEKYKVLSKVELESRYHINREVYEKTIDFEGSCALDIAKTMIAPAAVKHQTKLAKAIDALKKAGGYPSENELRKHLTQASTQVADMYANIEGLQKAIDKGDTKTTLKAMTELRKVVDELEAEVDDKLWPLPKYREMLFVY